MNGQTKTCDGKETSVGDLVRAARAGDSAAFGQLASRYQGTVYSVALQRLRNAAEAQELCQDVFFQAFRKLGQLHAPEAFGAWVRSIARRMAINRSVRRRQGLSATPESLEGACAQGESPLEAVLASEARAQVRAGLGRLKAMDRATLVAFYVDGQSLIEMSDRFDSPVGTIKRRLHVARKRLAKELVALRSV